jgi:hypothetical protein
LLYFLVLAAPVLALMLLKLLSRSARLLVENDLPRAEDAVLSHDANTLVVFGVVKNPAARFSQDRYGRGPGAADAGVEA